MSVRAAVPPDSDPVEADIDTVVENDSADGDEEGEGEERSALKCERDLS